MLVRFLFFIPLCAVLCSCASVSVRETERLKGFSATRVPEKILIKPFEYHDEAATVRVDRGGDALETFKFEQQEKLTRHLVRRIKKNIAPASPIAANAPLPRGNYWLITGRFDRINQGSRLMRSVIGLGSGGTKLETTVVVYDLSKRKPRPFLRLATTGGSNISPGVIGVATFPFSGPTALLNAGNILEGIRSGVTFDTIRTSREITAALSEYLYQQKAIEEDDALAPKRLGGQPIDIWPFRRKPQPLPEASPTPAPVKSSSRS